MSLARSLARAGGSVISAARSVGSLGEDIGRLASAMEQANGGSKR